MPQPTVLYPPLRFATVEEGIYRGAYPTLRNFRYLRRLRLRTVVSLAPIGATADLEAWCEAEEAQLVHYRTVPAAKGEPLSLTAATAAAVLSVRPVFPVLSSSVLPTLNVSMILLNLRNNL
jgi:tyrosine-protein phosphatase OCA6